MTKAAQRSTQKEYIPLDVEEITNKNTESRQPAKDAGENRFGYDSNKSVKEAAAKKEEAEKSVTADEDTSTTKSNEKRVLYSKFLCKRERRKSHNTGNTCNREPGKSHNTGNTCDREPGKSHNTGNTCNREPGNLTTQEIPVTESRKILQHKKYL